MDGALLSLFLLLLLLLLLFLEATLTASSSVCPRSPMRVSGLRGRGVSGSAPPDSPDQEVASFRSYERRKSFFSRFIILSDASRKRGFVCWMGSLHCVEISVFSYVHSLYDVIYIYITFVSIPPLFELSAREN